MRVILIYCLLIVALVGCATKSEVTKQSSSQQQAASPQQPTPAPTAANTASGAAEQQQPNVNAGTTTTQTDACALITKSEIEAVQGDSVKDTKSSSRPSGSLAISQCFYTLATFNKSVSLEVTRPNASDARQSGPKEFWQQTFHKKAATKEERDKQEKKEQKIGKPQPVPGIGDEAFWSGNRNSGALYVLKNNSILRISLGGPEEESVKIDKSKVLLQKALGRLL
jgi:hypothetical protein